MKTNDEWVEIQYQYDRIRYYKNTNKQFYGFYENGNTIKVRFINIVLSIGKVENL